MQYWYALYTKPKKEQQVNSWLQEQQVETYLPTVMRKRRRRDRPDRMVYFPCYLFARLDLQVTPHSSIAWMPGVRHVVSFGDQPAIVADEIIDLIQQRLGTIEVVGSGKFHPGDPVRITSGPLKDLEAVFDQTLSAAEKVRILLYVMGRMTPVDLDQSEIVRIERGKKR